MRYLFLVLLAFTLSFASAETVVTFTNGVAKLNEAGATYVLDRTGKAEITGRIEISATVTLILRNVRLKTPSDLNHAGGSTDTYGHCSSILLTNPNMATISPILKLEGENTLDATAIESPAPAIGVKPRCSLTITGTGSLLMKTKVLLDMMKVFQVAGIACAIDCSHSNQLKSINATGTVTIEQGVGTLETQYFLDGAAYTGYILDWLNETERRVDNGSTNLDYTVHTLKIVDNRKAASTFPATLTHTGRGVVTPESIEDICKLLGFVEDPVNKSESPSFLFGVERMNLNESRDFELGVAVICGEGLVFSAPPINKCFIIMKNGGTTTIKKYTDLEWILSEDEEAYTTTLVISEDEIAIGSTTIDLFLGESKEE